MKESGTSWLPDFAYGLSKFFHGSEISLQKGFIIFVI